MITPITIIFSPPPAIAITVDPRTTGAPGPAGPIGPPGPVTDVITVTYAEYVLLTPEELEDHYYVVTLTQEEYDNLSQEEMDSGDLWLVQNPSGGYSILNGTTLAAVISAADEATTAADEDKIPMLAAGGLKWASRATVWTWIKSKIESVALTLLHYPKSDPDGITGADAVTNIVSLTQAQYDAIVTPSATTQYIIVP
jgi:hypothetical protein